MAKNDRHAIEQAASLNRRDVLLGGAVATAMAVVPAAAAAESRHKTLETGSLYLDPVYANTFESTYSFDNIQNIHTQIRELYPNRSAMTWGDYQRSIAPEPKDWGTPGAFYKWPDFVAEARDDMEKQPANFGPGNNQMNPFDASKQANNLMEHLDEVVRIALWDYAVEVKINVGQQVRRHHGLTTEWTLSPVQAPASGSAPVQEITGLAINIDCPKGGWQGYTLWRNRPSTDPITQFVASWKVPPEPANKGKQIIFIFNGLESVSALNAVGGILQPVLQWTSGTPGSATDKGGWLVRSWYLRADFDPVAFPILPDPTLSALNYALDGTQDNRSFSKGVFVNPGDTITGTVQIGKDPKTQQPAYVCSLAVNGTTRTETELLIPVAAVPELIYAACAVESYYMPYFYPPYTTSVEGFYPPDPIVISVVNLATGSKVASIAWKASKTLGRDYAATAIDSGATVIFTLD